MKTLKMFTIHNIIQHNRLFRLVIFLIIIGLTIFLYTSYYANSTIDRLPSSQRLHMPSLISVSSILNNDKDNSLQQLNTSYDRNNDSNDNIKMCNQNVDDLSKKVPCTKTKTKNENSIDIMNLSDISIAQQSSSIGDNINTSFTSQQRLGAGGDPSSFLTSIASSDPLASILNSKNNNNSIDTLSATSNIMAVGKVQQNLIEALEEQKSHSISNIIEQAVNNNKITNNNNNKTNSEHLDTTKGIRTSDLYESGHSEANSELCGTNSGEHVRLLILITSAPTHHDAIRQTWGHYATRRDIAMAFVLGATNVQSIEDSLEAESYMYSDIIRGRFFDSYNNLTLKTISSLEWVDTYCSRAAFVLKTDDDMFINVQRLMSFIDKHHSNERVIYGRLAKKWNTK